MPAACVLTRDSLDALQTHQAPALGLKVKLKPRCDTSQNSPDRTTSTLIPYAPTRASFENRLENGAPLDAHLSPALANDRR
jgi:hypothetical protein